VQVIREIRQSIGKCFRLRVDGRGGRWHPGHHDLRSFGGDRLGNCRWARSEEFLGLKNDVWWQDDFWLQNRFAFWNRLLPDRGMLELFRECRGSLRNRGYGECFEYNRG